MVRHAIVVALIFSLFAWSGNAIASGQNSVTKKAAASDEAKEGDIDISYLFNTGYPPKLEQGVKYVPPTQEQKMWALATCGLLTEVRQERHDLLGGRERTPKGVEEEKESLSEWWGIESREDLFKALQWIEEGGHRRDFDELAKFVASLSPEQLSALQEQVSEDNQKACALDAVVENYKGLGAKSIAGWDYARYVALCGWGCYAGYISEDEAWEKIMPAARVLQQTFDSWDDLGRNYLVGRQFWSFEQTRRGLMMFMQAYMKLMADPSSPWARIEWNTDLNPPQHVKKDAKWN